MIACCFLLLCCVDERFSLFKYSISNYNFVFLIWFSYLNWFKWYIFVRLTFVFEKKKLKPKNQTEFQSCKKAFRQLWKVESHCQRHCCCCCWPVSRESCGENRCVDVGGVWLTRDWSWQARCRRNKRRTSCRVNWLRVVSCRTRPRASLMRCRATCTRWRSSALACSLFNQTRNSLLLTTYVCCINFLFYLLYVCCSYCCYVWISFDFVGFQLFYCEF